MFFHSTNMTLISNWMNLTKMFTFEKSHIDVSTKTYLASTKAIQKSLRPAWYERLWIWNHLLLLLLLRRLGLELRNGRVIPHVQLLGRGCVGVGGMVKRGATTLWKKVRRTQPKIFFFFEIFAQHISHARACVHCVQGDDERSYLTGWKESSSTPL